MKRHAVWVLAAVVAIVIAAPSLRGQCVFFDDPADYFRIADAVFIGTARKSQPTGAEGFHIVMHRVLFEIQGVWKGQVDKFETLGTVEAFEPGKRYLVFAGTGGDGRSGEFRLSTSLECGWTELESSATRKLRWLRNNVGGAKPVSDK